MMSLDWEHYRVFLAVIDEASLSGAARVLDAAQPTIRRRIEQMEHALGTVLFTRSPSGLAPTEAALRLVDSARAMAHAASAILRTASARPGEIEGLVRISASEIIAIEVLPPILARLRRQHPGIAIALSPNNRVEDVLRRESDIAVRMTRPDQAALVARRIGAVPLGLHAHRDYLAHAGVPETMDAVRRHALIGVETDSPVLRALRARGFPIDLRDFAFRSDNDLAHLAAIRAGLGIGICQIPLAAREPGLVRLCADQFKYDLETWVVTHEDLRHAPPVRAVFDALAQGLTDYLA
jgi:DNA-binding transcriptional LysR family regulator